jgi:DNA adenine methylase
MSTQTVLPFLRWAGGKRWLANQIAPILRKILDESGGTYHEPFLGAASMYFGLAPQRSVLSDLNKELIETYAQVRDSWREVEKIMRGFEVTKENYYKIRSEHPIGQARQAARFIWLNRTCYGGLYRVNQKNQFNVPYGGGRTPDVLYKNETLRICSDALQGKPYVDRSVELLISDFEEVMDRATSGDVIYCDPTYSRVTRDSFDRYGAIVFNWADQERLAAAARRVAGRGVCVLISNGFYKEIYELFKTDIILQFSKKKTIGNHASNDNKHMEYLFVWEPDSRRQGQRLWKNIEICNEIQRRTHRQVSVSPIGA